tara:strand:- start:128 stop:475 length:348 start_codon:yes stop_codon:yes gene_type:complete
MSTQSDNKVYMHFDTLEDGTSVWLIPMPDGETKSISASVARTIFGNDKEIRVALDEIAIDTILELNDRGLEVVMLQGQGHSTEFHVDGTQTIYERNEVSKQGQVFDLRKQKARIR